jgi:4-aminobutyrate aminotransferase/(S)-3-amino-2-methylpropionate transaminase
MLYSAANGLNADLICLGKGLGGGLPLSACLGRGEVMQSWQREPEVVHTSTFAGAPLACATALATLDALSREGCIERSRDVGHRWLDELRMTLTNVRSVRDVRGAGLMLGIDLGNQPGSASAVQRQLLERGWITSTGGGQREVLVLTPPLNVAEQLLHEFNRVCAKVLRALA